MYSDINFQQIWDSSAESLVKSYLLIEPDDVIENTESKSEPKLTDFGLMNIGNILSQWRSENNDRMTPERIDDLHTAVVITRAFMDRPNGEVYEDRNVSRFESLESKVLQDYDALLAVEAKRPNRRVDEAYLMRMSPVDFVNVYRTDMDAILWDNSARTVRGITDQNLGFCNKALLDWRIGNRDRMTLDRLTVLAEAVDLVKDSVQTFMRQGVDFSDEHLKDLADLDESVSNIRLGKNENRFSGISIGPDPSSAINSNSGFEL